MGVNRAQHRVAAMRTPQRASFCFFLRRCVRLLDMMATNIMKMQSGKYAYRFANWSMEGMDRMWGESDRQNHVKTIRIFCDSLEFFFQK